MLVLVVCSLLVLLLMSMALPHQVITVNPSSLKRWFLANPSTGRHRMGALAVPGRRNQSNLPSYLQAGMNNPNEMPQPPIDDVSGGTGITVSLISQSSGEPERIVMQDEDVKGPAGFETRQAVDGVSKKALRDKVAHPICGRLTYYLRQGKIRNKVCRND